MNWYKTARRNIYQTVSQRLSSYILQRYKEKGTDEIVYSIRLDELYNMTKDIVSSKDFFWDNLSEVKVKYNFEFPTRGKNIVIGASMGSNSNMRLNIAIDSQAAHTDSEKIYKELYYELYSVINHELEHAKQDKDKRRSGTPVDEGYVQYRQEGNLINILSNYRNYLLQDSEVEAYAVGIYRSSIAKKVNPSEALKQFALHVMPTDQEIIRGLEVDEMTNGSKEVFEMRSNIVNEFVSNTTTYLQNRYPNFTTV